MSNLRTLYVFVCPRGCTYCPGYFGKKPLGKQICHNCREPLRRHQFAIPGPSMEPLPKAGVR